MSNTVIIMLQLHQVDAGAGKLWSDAIRELNSSCNPYLRCCEKTELIVSTPDLHLAVLHIDDLIAM